MKTHFFYIIFFIFSGCIHHFDKNINLDECPEITQINSRLDKLENIAIKNGDSILLEKVYREQIELLQIKIDCEQNRRAKKIYNKLLDEYLRQKRTLKRLQ